MDQRHGHLRNPDRAGAFFEEYSGNAKVNFQVDGKLVCVAANVVDGVNTSGAKFEKRRFKGDAF
jgi:hypothetical protein